MKLTEIYKAAVETGINNDPRGAAAVNAILKETSKKYSELSPDRKKYYDTQKLYNPYADSRILHDAGNNIKTVLVGIDMEVPELLLMDRLNEKGMKIDAVIAHHPEGCAMVNFYEVMSMQADIFNSFGVNIAASEALLDKRKKEVGERVSAGNHYRVQDAAKLLNISMMNMHTPADNSVVKYLQKRFDSEKPKKVSDIIDMLMEEPEYKAYAKRGNGPEILIGNKDRSVKKVMVDMTGGTEGPKEIYEKVASAGVDTIVGMHFSADHKKELEKANLNVVIAGHISSDVVGMNIVLDAIEKKCGKLNVVDSSGFIRFKRK
ncbi:MAG: NGG1p interacting factor NIF3 [Candidatus Goldbacteria bacterium]|nr:NGG1p interacting factor NIF3 [Candidatus Goldiibacteriota bacterium]